MSEFKEKFLVSEQLYQTVVAHRDRCPRCAADPSSFCSDGWSLMQLYYDFEQTVPLPDSPGARQLQLQMHECLEHLMQKRPKSLTYNPPAAA